MPKERVFGGEPNQPFEMVVGWQRDRHMQVGIVIAEPQQSGDPTTITEVLFSYEAREQAAKALHSSGIADLSEDVWAEVVNEVLAELCTYERGQGVTPGLYWTPTRHGVNSLIRTLRKARDAAFGKDE